MFKKIISLSFCFLISCLLFSCHQTERITILVPKGSPEYAVLYLDDENYNVEVVNGPDPLIAAFGSKTYDVIVAPTNLGAKFYQSSTDYQLNASIVWGNYYLISADPLTVDDLADQTINTFGQNQTPDIVLNYLLSNNQINATCNYLSSSLEISTQFMMDPHQIYMIAEPALSALIHEYGDIHTLDLQALYTEASGQMSYPQASVFIRSSLSEQTVHTVQNDIEQSVTMINDKTNIDQTKSLLESSLDTQTLYASITRSHLSFLSAQQAKSQVESYFSLILNQNSALIGNSLPADSFYR